MKKSLFTFLLLIYFSLTYANGVLIVDRAEGDYFRMTDSSVNVMVQNQIATVTSSQTFLNNFGSPQLVEYAFPVPAGASVTSLRWRIDGGEWAIATFSATDPTDPPGGGSGETTNSNLTAYLGNTPLYFAFLDAFENESIIEVEITYVELLPYSFDEVTFTYPSNYNLIQSDIIDNSQVFNFELTSERTIDSVENFNNDDGIVTNDGTSAMVTIDVLSANSINDILIVYQLASDELGVIAFSTFLEDGINECDDLGNGFFGLVIEPESNEDTEVIDKNFTLIIDTSGSMSGQKFAQAQEAAIFIVNNLNTGDFFNIIAFSSSVTPFSATLLEYNVANATNAISFINDLNAGGGTNISGSLTTAIGQFDVVSEGFANIIVFFTDGQATSGITSTPGIINAVDEAVNANETEIFLYTFGIGGNVTTDLLTNLAIDNNGFATFLGDDEIEDVISNFYLTIRNPVLLNTGITTNPPDILNAIYPDPLPNLYKGQQLILTGRYSIPQDFTLTLSGNAFNSDVEYNYDLNLSDANNENFAFLPKLWAKSKIESLTVQYNALPEDSPEAELLLEEIEEVSICYQVLSPFTSLIDDGLSVDELEFMEDDNNTINFHPNPFAYETRGLIKLNAPEKIVVSIYSIDGKLIREIIIDGKYGNNIIVWDGNDQAQNSVSSGMYIYTIKLGNEIVYNGKIVKK